MCCKIAICGPPSLYSATPPGTPYRQCRTLSLGCLEEYMHFGIRRNVQHAIFLIWIYMNRYIFPFFAKIGYAPKRLPPFHPSDLNFWSFFDLKIVLLVTRDVGNLSSKFECCTVFGLRVNGGHGTTAGCRLTRYAASRSAWKHNGFHSSKALKMI